MADSRSVVVGIDHEGTSTLALPWAIADARSRGLPVRIVCTYAWMLRHPWEIKYSDEVTIPELAFLRRIATEAVARATDEARAMAPEVEISGEAIEGPAVRVLLTESGQAAELVLGSRHLKALGAVVLGSVSGAVAPRAQCPVIVTRGPAGDAAEGASVVVGVDESEQPQAVLGFAFDYARRHRVPVRPVLCWRPDTLASMKWRPEPPPPAVAEEWLNETCAVWRDKYPDVEVHTAVIRDHPVAGLVRVSAAQQLLVVGTHARRALVGTLLGSVSQGVLHHATCPVAVIPGDEG